MIQEITTEQLKEKMKEPHNVVLIEVLEPAQYRLEHIRGAINIALREIGYRAKQRFRLDQELILYCSGPQCKASGMAAEKLETVGFSNVFHYAGGKQEWKEAGYPMTRGEAAEENGPTEVRFNNEPITLCGRVLRPGYHAPDCELLSNDLQPVHLSDFSDRIRVIASFLSVDTTVCTAQLLAFNRQAKQLGSEVVCLAVSKDLPFAQTRFALENNLRHIRLFSDYVDHSFAANYGLLIRELDLTARAITIVDANDTLRYQQIVTEQSSEPDLDQALSALQEVLDNPRLDTTEAPAALQCEPCRTGIGKLSAQEIEASQPPRWELVGDSMIMKVFAFPDFTASKQFVDLVAAVAQVQDHHPDVGLSYKQVRIELTTHKAGGLTKNDFIMAAIIDTMYDRQQPEE